MRACSLLGAAFPAHGTATRTEQQIKIEVFDGQASSFPASDDRRVGQRKTRFKAEACGTHATTILAIVT